METSRRALLLVALGGTIAFSDGPAGAMPARDAAELLAMVRDEPVDTVDLTNTSSSALEDHHLLELVRTVERGIADGYEGVVVTQGTDTIEEVAYLLALTTPPGRIPIVLTGAMRHGGSTGSDGLANLSAALQAARDPGLRDAGPVVAFGDEIHSARFVTKAKGTGLNAFRSSHGPLGEIVEGRIRVYLKPTRSDYLRPLVGAGMPRVELATMALGSDSRVPRALLDSDPDGLVFAGLGGGAVPLPVVACVEEAGRAGIPVVVASRGGDGPTLQDTYGVPGAEIDLQARGAVMAGALSAPKARLRLAVALANRIPAADAFPVF
jgi:L-asparaginase